MRAVDDMGGVGAGLDERFIPSGDDLEDIAKVIVGSAAVMLATSLTGNLGGAKRNVVFIALAVVLFAWIVYRRKD